MRNDRVYPNPGFHKLLSTRASAPFAPLCGYLYCRVETQQQKRSRTRMSGLRKCKVWYSSLAATNRKAQCQHTGEQCKRTRFGHLSHGEAVEIEVILCVAIIGPAVVKLEVIEVAK